MEISRIGLELIESNEGFRSERYDDVDGTPTIGYGTTAGAGVVEPLPATCTQAEAEMWLKEYVDKAIIPAIEGLKIDLNQNQIDALCDLAYNCGAGIISGDTTIGNDLRAKNLEAASAAFMLYDHDANGQVLSDLQRRRAQERALFDKPMPVAGSGHGIAKFLVELDLADDRWQIHHIPGTAHYKGTKTWAAEVRVLCIDGKAEFKINRN